MKPFLALGTFVSLLVAAGCSGSAGISVGADPSDGGGSGNDGGSGTDGGSGGCTQDSDCGSTGICGFLQADACLAHGACFPKPQGQCEAFSAGCACDGTQINVACNGLPSGYVPKPLLHAGACTTDGGGGPCHTDADCGATGMCGFPTSGGCGVAGTCFPKPSGGLCNSFSPGCACDGSVINVVCSGYPQGYASKPITGVGTCGDPTSNACTTNADCPSNGICGFASADACTAKGTCFAASGPTCGAFSPGCACDGSTINVACTGLPNGYETKPLAHTGTCGAASDGGGPCQSDGDCRLFSNTCNTCSCLALSKAQSDPTCNQPGNSCLVDPCDEMTATCDNGTCAVH